MTALESFEAKKHKVEKALCEAITQSIKTPEGLAGFCEWMGMTYKVSPEDPCDEEFMKKIMGA